MPNNGKEQEPHGLHTPQELSLAGRIRLALRRHNRKIYKSLRHPSQRRKGRFRNWLGGRIHDRNLWRFRRHPVANGFAGGLFIAMLPVPAQSLIAGAVGIARGWNLPAAILATWVSNPLTYVPMFIAAKACVVWIYGLFDATPAIKNLSPSAFQEWNWEEWDWAGLADFAKHAGMELLMGYILVGVLSAIAGYIVVHGLWWLVAHLEEPLHHARPDRPARKPAARETPVEPTKGG